MNVEVQPIVGPISGYPYAFRTKLEDERLRALWTELARHERAVVRGDFSTVEKFYQSVPKDSPFFLSAASVVFAGAIGLGDRFMFDSLRNDVQAYPELVGTDEAKLATDLFGVWVRQHLGNFLRQGVTGVGI